MLAHYSSLTCQLSFSKIISILYSKTLILFFSHFYSCQPSVCAFKNLLLSFKFASPKTNKSDYRLFTFFGASGISFSLIRNFTQYSPDGLQKQSTYHYSEQILIAVSHHGHTNNQNFLITTAPSCWELAFLQGKDSEPVSYVVSRSARPFQTS